MSDVEHIDWDDILADWKLYLEHSKPLVAFLAERGCTPGEALILIHLHMLGHQNEAALDRFRRPPDGEEWRGDDA